jgi:hypothetical protein
MADVFVQPASLSVNWLKSAPLPLSAGLFKGWAQPTPISHPSSTPFIDATYKLVTALGQSAFVWIRGDRPQGGITIVETNPTVALAIMMWRNGAGRQVARALGQLRFGDHTAQCSNTWGKLPGRIIRGEPNEATPQAEQYQPAKGECCTLILADNGGAWEKHNPWLRDLASPLRVAPAGGAGGTISLRRASGSETSGQWKLSPTALKVAKENGWSSDTGCLTLQGPCSIDVRLLD